MSLITLYKPLSPAQLAAVIAGGWRGFAAESTQQRLFYPKIYRPFAEQIARQWHAAHFSAGYVVRFSLPRHFMARYPIQTIGYEQHSEYKVPISELARLNRRICGQIEVVTAYSGQPDHIALAACVGF